jgi:D-galactarolactone cycloisomerase
MKITDIRVTVIRQKLAQEFWIAELPITSISETMIEVFTDEGVMGMGEATRGIPEKTGRAVLDFLKPRLLGKNPLETESLWEDMFAVTRGHEWRAKGLDRPDIMNAMAGIDIALWDIKGKAASMPVYLLLGGSGAPQSIYATLGYYDDRMSQEQRAEHLAEQVNELGLQIVKIKIGRDPVKDLEWVKRARELLGPDVGLMLDANLGYDVNTAIDAGKRFAEYDIYWYEEPVHWYDRYKGLGLVAGAVPIPLHAGESEDHRFQCRDLVVDGKIRYCSFDASRAGGVTEWLRIAHFCNIHHVLMAPHCQPQVHAHLMAAVSNGSMVEIHPDEVRHPLWNHGYVDRAVIKDNKFYLTEKPGFGVEISGDYLKEYGTKLT